MPSLQELLEKIGMGSTSPEGQLPGAFGKDLQDYEDGTFGPASQIKEQADLQRNSKTMDMAAAPLPGPFSPELIKQYQDVMAKQKTPVSATEDAEDTAAKDAADAADAANKEPSAIARMLSAAAPSAQAAEPSATPDFYSDEALTKAQGAQSAALKDIITQKNLNQMVASASGLGAGAMIKPLGVPEEANQLANLNVKNLEERRKGGTEKFTYEKAARDAQTDTEMSNSNSAISKAYRELYAAHGGKLTGTESATEIKAISPMFDTLYKADAVRDAATAKLKAMQIGKDVTTNLQKERLGIQKDRLISSVEGKFNNALTVETKNPSSVVGGAAKLVQGANRLEAAFARKGGIKDYSHITDAEVKNLNKMHPQMVDEMTLMLAGILSQGAMPAVSTQESLAIKTMEKDAAALKQYITGKIAGAGAGDFLRTIMNTAQSEKATAQAAVNEYLQGQLAGFQEYAKLAPENYLNLLYGKHLISAPDYLQAIEPYKDSTSIFTKANLKALNAKSTQSKPAEPTNTPTKAETTSFITRLEAAIKNSPPGPKLEAAKLKLEELKKQQ